MDYSKLAKVHMKMQKTIYKDWNNLKYNFMSDVENNFDFDRIQTKEDFEKFKKDLEKILEKYNIGEVYNDNLY